MRVFVAVEINNSDIIKSIKNIQTEFTESLPDLKCIKLVDADMLHFTLQFLGDIPDTKQAPITTALSTIEFVPFDIEIKTVGAFPNPKVPKIVWVGADTPIAVTAHNGTQHNGTQHNGTQHNGTQHNGTQHNGTQHNNTNRQYHHNNNNSNITELAQKVAKVLEPLGYKRDKPFKPHSTIFRVKMREQSITNKLNILKNTTFGIQKIKEIKLKKSQLTPKGPIYTDLAVIKSRDE